MADNAWRRILGATILCVWLVATLLILSGKWDGLVWEAYEIFDRQPGPVAMSWELKAIIFAGLSVGMLYFFGPEIAAEWKRYRANRAAKGPPGELAPHYVFGLAGGDRFIKDDLSKALSAFEERVNRKVEATEDKLNAVLPPKALLERLDKLDTDIKATGQSLKVADRTLLQLVDFATHQVVAASLKEMIDSAPPTLSDNELSEEGRTKQIEYLGLIRSQLSGTHRGQSVANILQAAEHEAERIIEDTPFEQRNPADPIRYRRWAIANRQVASIVMFLRAQRAETEQRIVGYRSALIEELTRRSS